MTTSTRAKVPPAATRYEDDVYTWLQEQIALLRAGKIADIDADNIAEELSDVASAIRDQFESAIAVLTQHLLKWEHQPERRSRSWMASVAEQRRRITKLLRRHPGLKGTLAEAIEEGYADGRDRASGETNLPVKVFPAVCPYTFDDLMTRPIDFDSKPAPARKSRSRAAR